MKYLIDKELLEEAIGGLKVFGQVATSVTVEKLEKLLTSENQFGKYQIGDRVSVKCAFGYFAGVITYYNRQENGYSVCFDDTKEDSPYLYIEEEISPEGTIAHGRHTDIGD